jgi:hypothetical protein
MLLRDASMQESSRGASPQWVSLREPSGNAVSKRINLALVEKLFPFGVYNAFITRVALTWTSQMVPNQNYNLVVDSRILSVI